MATIWNRMLSDAVTDVGSGDGLSEVQLQRILDAHWSRICQMLFQLVGDRAEAEDLALEVFYRLHKRPPRDMGAVGSWLYRVATNVGLNALRANKRRSSYEQTAGRLDLEHETSLDPAVELDRKEERLRVRAVLTEMQPRAAQLLFLRYLGLSYRELARSLKLAPGSVGTLLARAQKEFERRYRALEDVDDASD